MQKRKREPNGVRSVHITMRTTPQTKERLKILAQINDKNLSDLILSRMNPLLDKLEEAVEGKKKRK